MCRHMTVAATVQSLSVMPFQGCMPRFAPALSRSSRGMISVARSSNAGRLIAEMRGGVDEDMPPQNLTNKQTVALHQLLHEAKFKDPDKDHLSPAGAVLLPTPVAQAH